MVNTEKMTCGRKSIIAVLYEKMIRENLLSEPEDCKDACGNLLALSELILEGQVRISQKDQHTGRRGGKESPADGMAWSRFGGLRYLSTLN